MAQAEPEGMSDVYKCCTHVLMDTVPNFDVMMERRAGATRLRPLSTRPQSTIHKMKVVHGLGVSVIYIPITSNTFPFTCAVLSNKSMYQGDFNDQI